MKRELEVLTLHSWGDAGKGYYTLPVACLNCSARFIGKFIRGYGASGEYRCPNCGCPRLRVTR